MMKCWYFEFEGAFTEDELEDYNKGVISSCLIPEREYKKAKKLLITALKQKKIHLVQIMEYFSIDETTMDMNSNDNEFWIDWYTETVLLNDVNFEKMYLFPKDEIKE